MATDFSKTNICWFYNSLPNNMFYCNIIRNDYELIYSEILTKKEFEIFCKIMLDTATALLYIKNEKLGKASQIKINWKYPIISLQEGENGRTEETSR